MTISATLNILLDSNTVKPILSRPQATQAHDQSAVSFSIFIDFVWKIHFGSKSYKI